jgi:ADP-ribose pyrophosphatase YjhB (NUDIX family)
MPSINHKARHNILPVYNENSPHKSARFTHYAPGGEKQYIDPGAVPPPTQALSTSVLNKPRKKMIITNGLACLRRGQTYEILLIRRRLTYAFTDFVKGIYEPDILTQLNKMTVDERIDVGSLNFGAMWYKLYQQTPNSYSPTRRDHDNNYYRCQSIFNNKFMTDKGAMLLKLLEMTYYEKRQVSLMWEMPKGYSTFGETAIQCAVREFMEETQMHRDSFRLIPGEMKIHSYQADNNKIYSTTYFTAICSDGSEPSITMCNSKEVSAIAWMSLAKIKETAPHLYNICSRIISSFKIRSNIIDGRPSISHN